MRTTKLNHNEIIALAKEQIGVTPVIDNIYRCNTDNIYLIKVNNLFYVNSDLEQLINSTKVKGKGVKLNQVAHVIHTYHEARKIYVWATKESKEAKKKKD